MAALVYFSDAENVLCMICNRSVIGICPHRNNEIFNLEKTPCGVLKAIRSTFTEGAVTREISYGSAKHTIKDRLIDRELFRHIVCNKCNLMGDDCLGDSCSLMQAINKLSTKKFREVE